ncbi:unnamed protein product [Chrysoparadoxa australica]
METTRASLWARLVVFYSVHNPKQLRAEVINEILTKYHSREKQLRAKLFKKYGQNMPFSVLSSEVASVMAAFSLEDGCPDEKLGGRSEQLDFCSEHFRPQLALDERVQPPVAAVRPMDNVSKCRGLLPIWHEDYRDGILPSNRGAEGATKQSAGATSAAGKQRSAMSQSRNPITSIMKHVSTQNGPFSLLLTWFEAKSRISVMIRRVNDIRGVCTGMLRAFDRHMNLYMVNVRENYMVLVKGSDNRQVKQRRERLLKQLIIRGDNIVMCWEESQHRRAR